MDIWIAEKNSGGRWAVHQIDSGRADPEGVGQWLAETIKTDTVNNPIVFFGTLSQDV